MGSASGKVLQKVAEAALLLVVPAVMLENARRRRS